MKKLHHYSKSFSNRRAVSLERRQYDYQKSKQDIKRSSVIIKGQTAKYHAEQKRYIESVSFPIPQFEEPVMTSDTLEFAEETRTMNMLSDLMANASTSEFPKYVSDSTWLPTIKRLVAPPQTPEDHYLATGGIIYHRRPEA